MPTHIIIVVQDNRYEIIKPLAFLSKIIKTKYNEQKNVTTDTASASAASASASAASAASIILEDISRESFDKFIEFSEIYFGMNSDEASVFTKDIYVKTYKKSKHYKWMNEIYNSLTKEQIIGLAVLAEKLHVKFLIHYLGCKLSDSINDDKFFNE